MTRVGDSDITTIESSLSSSRSNWIHSAQVGPPTNVTAQGERPRRLRARATLIPLPPTSLRTETPRTRSPGFQPGTTRVLSRHGFNVTHSIMSSPTVPEDHLSHARLDRRKGPRSFP